jgi:hypothetical protein
VLRRCLYVLHAFPEKPLQFDKYMTEVTNTGHAPLFQALFRKGTCPQPPVLGKSGYDNDCRQKKGRGKFSRDPHFFIGHSGYFCCI